MPTISSSCASPCRFLLWSWSVAGGRRGRHQIMEWRRAGRKHDAIYPHHSCTSLVRPPPSPSDPTLDRTVSLSIVSAILERESNQEARSGERGREEQSSGRCSSLCPSHRSPSPATAITFLCCPLLIKHFYLVQVCTRRDAHCSRHLPLALLRRPSCE